MAEWLNGFFVHFIFLFPVTIFQALNGFLMILTCDGEVFFATHSIESYLGFHQVSVTHTKILSLLLLIKSEKKLKISYIFMKLCGRSWKPDE